MRLTLVSQPGGVYPLIELDGGEPGILVKWGSTTLTISRDGQDSLCVKHGEMEQVFPDTTGWPAATKAAILRASEMERELAAIKLQLETVLADPPEPGDDLPVRTGEPE